MSQISTDGARRALIIDDSRASAALAGVMLQAAGWDFDHALDGFEGISLLRKQSYAAVLLDYRLPGMDGVQVMEWIRKNIMIPPAVIVLSSDCPDMLGQRFDGLGVKAVLSKPVAASELCRAIGA